MAYNCTTTASSPVWSNFSGQEAIETYPHLLFRIYSHPHSITVLDGKFCSVIKTASPLPPTEPVRYIPVSSVWSLLMLAESSPLSIYILPRQNAVRLREFFFFMLTILRGKDSALNLVEFLSTQNNRTPLSLMHGNQCHNQNLMLFRAVILYIFSIYLE